MLSVEGLSMTLSINDAQNNNNCHHAESHYDECRILFVVMLGVILLNVVVPFHPH